MMGYAISRINSLKHEIKEYEKLKKIAENKNYILKIAKSNREDEMTDTDTEKKKIGYEEKMEKLKQKREEAYQKAREKTAKQLRKPKKGKAKRRKKRNKKKQKNKK